MGIQAILDVNTVSQTHAHDKLPPSAPNVVNAAPGVATSVSSCGKKNSLTSRHEPDPYVRTTATNGDHDEIAEAPTTATTAPGPKW